MVYGPFSRTLKHLTICRGNYKGNTFSSVILRPWVLVWCGAKKKNENRTSVPKIVAADIVILDC